MAVLSLAVRTFITWKKSWDYNKKISTLPQFIDTIPPT